MGWRVLGRDDPLHARVSFLILTLLAIKPSHGYELLKAIEKLTMGLLKPGPGTIYPVLRSLREEGLVEEEVVVENGRAKRVYKLTDRGREELATRLTLFKAVTANILDLVEAASKALPHPPACPPLDVVERLEALREMVDVYIGRLREALRECGAGHAGGEGAREAGRSSG